MVHPTVQRAIVQSYTNKLSLTGWSGLYKYPPHRLQQNSNPSCEDTIREVSPTLPIPPTFATCPRPARFTRTQHPHAGRSKSRPYPITRSRGHLAVSRLEISKLRHDRTRRVRYSTVQYQRRRHGIASQCRHSIPRTSVGPEPAVGLARSDLSAFEMRWALDPCAGTATPGHGSGSGPIDAVEIAGARAQDNGTRRIRLVLRGVLERWGGGWTKSFIATMTLQGESNVLRCQCQEDVVVVVVIPLEIACLPHCSEGFKRGGC